MGTWEVLGSDRHQADDATNEHYSMFFCDEEGTQSCFQGVRDVIEGQGLFCSLYTERVFSTHQDRLVKKLEEANRYLAETYLPAYNAEFTQPPPEAGSEFVACWGVSVLDDILCERFDRTVNVLRYTDNTLAIHHGPQELARYDANGQVISNELPVAA